MIKDNKLSPFKIIMRDHITSESYRVNEKLFQQIKNKLTQYRSVATIAKSIRCIETDEIFKSAYKVKCWLITNGLTSNSCADTVIKNVCKGKLKSAYGYHWEFYDNNLGDYSEMSEKIKKFKAWYK